jgi:transaldolase/fructose-6-phosphate aldolase-like protein
MTLPCECWWDSAPELIDQRWDADGASTLGPFSGVTTNPMLMLEACTKSPPARGSGSGWDLYLACCARSARYLASRGLTVPHCVQLDPRSAFDTPSMLAQAAEIRDRIPSSTIKVPLTSAGIETIRALSAQGVGINATWGFCVAQLVAAAQAMAEGQARAAGQAGAAPPRPRYVLTLMEGRIGELGLRAHLGDEPHHLRAAECVVFEAAYDSLRRYRDVATLLASSLRPGPGDECWHYGTMAGREVILTLPPSFLRQRGLPAPGAEYGRADEESRKLVLDTDAVRRYVAEDGFEPAEFDRLPSMVKTHGEAVRAMEGFERLARHG